MAYEDARILNPNLASGVASTTSTTDQAKGTEVTLGEVLTNLLAVTEQLEFRVFGDRPKNQEARPVSENKIVDVRNVIADIVMRLHGVNEGLRLLA